MGVVGACVGCCCAGCFGRGDDCGSWRAAAEWSYGAGTGGKYMRCGAFLFSGLGDCGAGWVLGEGFSMDRRGGVGYLDVTWGVVGEDGREINYVP